MKEREYKTELLRSSLQVEYEKSRKREEKVESQEVLFFWVPKMEKRPR